MKTRIILIIFSLGTVFQGFSQQDKHLSMFAEAPVFLNPAAAGFAPGNLQLFSNFRMQWTTVSNEPYRTMTAGADWKMMDKGNGFMGAGINFTNDAAGVTNYQTNVIAVPVNYAILLNKSNLFSVGIQPAYYQRSVSTANASWDNQWTGIEFDPTIDNQEAVPSQNYSLSKFDVSMGVYWETFFSKYSKLTLGISGQHLTKQRINILTDDNGLYRKLNVHGQGSFGKMNSTFTLEPAFMFFVQGPNKEFTFGSNYKFLLKSGSLITNYFNDITLSLGTYYRVGDAFMVNAILDMSGLGFGASYDFNMSSLTRATNGLGGMEFFIRYRLQFGTGDLGNNRVH
ncbi:PorP/SprF family type IX secretion system membrane protein [Crocinitomix catalasitica]|uniref:PorP/SprF family type IX secretion system membrane protein n=1 Tax=Crocinitomix catalasitica TaxID=184607 RepID=UPI000907715A|nr:PorP/SprF family type IX secretion system membrane protein [Crocinitomix catalasitica]